MKEMIDRMTADGFEAPAEMQPDGKFYRFSRNGSNDSGWAVCWQNAKVSDGTFYYVGMYGDFRTYERFTYKPEKASREDQAVMEGQLKQRQADAQKARDDHQVAVSVVWDNRFKRAAKVGTTPYMLRKGIADLYGACIYGDNLQVPLRDTKGNLWSMQTIYPDGGKNFAKGGKKKGLFHVIGAPLTNETVGFICEGFATGASVHRASGKTVVVAFDAGNLVEVAQELRRDFSGAELTVCGDDDFSKDPNVGREKADKAAMILNSAAIFPVFPDGIERGTDFNDLHMSCGIAAVTAIVEPEREPERKTGYIPLGFNGANYFFYHIPSKDIVQASSFTDTQLFSIAPMEYWEAAYPTKKGGINIAKAKNDLIQKCKMIGPFDASRVRGSGVWIDDGRKVYNTGHSLHVDGRELALSSFAGWHIYIQTEHRLPPLHQEPLTREEGVRISEVVRRFKWKNKTDHLQLCGWIFNARIAGALPIRAHAWITGGKGTGKSTVMERVVANLLGSPKGHLHLIGNSTEAGIRQALRCSARPVVFDEFETTGRASRERIDANIELFRNCWSATQGKVLKGGSNGTGIEYAMCSPALVSSIRVNLQNDADRSRFSILELMEHGSSPVEWDALRRELEFFTIELGERLFARAVRMIDVVIDSQAIIGKYLSKVSQRYAQQVGFLLAGWWCLTNDHVITQSEAERLCEDFFAKTDDDESITEEMNDEQECLNHLLTTMISLRLDAGGVSDRPIGDIVGDKEGRDQDLLVKYGVKVVRGRFIVANKHTELSKIFRGTRWEGCWSRTLKRLPGAQATSEVSFGSRLFKSRAVSLPIDI